MTALSPATDTANDDPQSASRSTRSSIRARSPSSARPRRRARSAGRSCGTCCRRPFGGTVYPVNPTRPAILGVKAYPSIGAIGEPVDLAVIVTPAKTAPGLVEECGQAGVKGVIIISAGFKEIGPEGVELERQVLEAARRHGIRRRSARTASAS